MAAEMALPMGRELNGYRILSALGQGGMATVYRALQLALDREVALKVLPANLASDPSFKSRFRQEARAVAQLRHPNILDVHDYGDRDGTAYIVTELITGGTLEARLGTPMPVEEVVAILAPIASALDHAHSHGILHRDVKPSNILLTDDGTPVLSDFGLMRMLGKDTSLTETGMVMGTPDYMAPEQCEGEELGPAADIYALATVAFQLLTGVLPFTADTPMKVIVAKLREPATRARVLRPDLGPDIESALMRGMALNPAQRFYSATALVDALAGRGSSGIDSTVHIRSAFERFQEHTVSLSRNPMAYALTGALLVLAGILSVNEVPPRPIAHGPAPLAAPFSGGMLLLQNNPQTFIVDSRIAVPSQLSVGTPVLVKADAYTRNRVVLLAVYDSEGSVTTYSAGKVVEQENSEADHWEIAAALAIGIGLVLLAVSTVIYAVRGRRHPAPA